jgi:hypothetical protein
MYQALILMNLPGQQTFPKETGSSFDLAVNPVKVMQICSQHSAGGSRIFAGKNFATSTHTHFSLTTLAATPISSLPATLVISKLSPCIAENII